MSTTTIAFQVANTVTGAYDVHKPMPFPFQVDDSGLVADPAILDEVHARLLGFQNDVDEQHVDLAWVVAAAAPQEALGKFPVFVSEGRIWTYRLPVTSAEVVGARA